MNLYYFNGIKLDFDALNKIGNNYGCFVIRKVQNILIIIYSENILALLAKMNDGCEYLIDLHKTDSIICHRLTPALTRLRL